MEVQSHDRIVILVLAVIVVILIGVIVILAVNFPFFANETGNPRSWTPPPKESLTSSQKKLSTDLLQLTDSRFLPAGISLDSLESQMEQNHQLIHISSPAAPQANVRHNTLVYVYISTTENIDMNSIRSAVWNVTDVDTANRLVVAWVDVNNLTYLASFDSVNSIRTVMPPITT